MTQKMNKFNSLKKTTKVDFATYLGVIVVFIITTILQNNGSLKRSAIGLLVPICCYMSMAVSLNLTVGILGELSLGHAGFMSVGAFSGIVVSQSLAGLIPNGPVRLALSMFIGALLAALVGLLIGTPVLRLQGDYLAIVTLAFGEIIKELINCLIIGCDEKGLHFVFNLSGNKTVDDLGLSANGTAIIKGAQGATGTKTIAGLTAGFILVMVTRIIVLNLTRSRAGRAIMAIRDNRIAAESVVLLKNDSIGLHPGSLPQPLLPLKKEGTVAVIGPLGNTRSNMPGTWSVAARLNDYPSLYEGPKEMMSGKVNVTYAKGSNLIGDAAYEERATMFGRSLNRDNRTDKELLDEALKTAAGADVIIAALGESSEMSGESSSRTNLDLPDVQRSLLEALLKTGKPVAHPLHRTSADADLGAGERTRHTECMVWRKRSRLCHRRRIVRRCQPQRKADDDFPEERRANTSVLQPQEYRTPATGRQMVREVPQQLPGCGQRAALSLWIRLVLHHFPVQ